MEAPRLRLIILAAVRGLVKPGYDYGVSSVIREDLLTRAISREIDGQTLTHRGVLEAAIAQITDPAWRPTSYRHAVGYVMQGNAMTKLQPARNVRKIQLNRDDRVQIKNAVTMLNLLKRTDFYDRMAAVLKAAVPK